MKKKHILIAALAIIAPIVLNSVSKLSVSEWQNMYYVNEMKPEQKNGMASFIYYLARQKPSEKIFGSELALVLKQFPNYSNDFRLAMIKLCEDAFTQTYEAGQLTQSAQGSKPAKDPLVWRKSLLKFYGPLYDMLTDAQQKIIAYGLDKGKALPTPQEFMGAAMNPMSKT